MTERPFELRPDKARGVMLILIGAGHGVSEGSGGLGAYSQNIEGVYNLVVAGSSVESIGYAEKITPANFRSVFLEKHQKIPHEAAEEIEDYLKNAGRRQ